VGSTSDVPRWCLSRKDVFVASTHVLVSIDARWQDATCRKSGRPDNVAPAGVRRAISYAVSARWCDTEMRHADAARCQAHEEAGTAPALWSAPAPFHRA
jgi:hypothetical protein